MTEFDGIWHRPMFALLAGAVSALTITDTHAGRYDVELDMIGISAAPLEQPSPEFPDGEMRGGQEGWVRMNFHGSTPLGTSAGTGEAVHRVDAVFEGSEYLEAVEAHGFDALVGGVLEQDAPRRDPRLRPDAADRVSRTRSRARPAQG